MQQIFREVEQRAKRKDNINTKNKETKEQVIIKKIIRIFYIVLFWTGKMIALFFKQVLIIKKYYNSVIYKFFTPIHKQFSCKIR